MAYTTDARNATNSTLTTMSCPIRKKNPMFNEDIGDNSPNLNKKRTAPQQRCGKTTTLGGKRIPGGKKTLKGRNGTEVTVSTGEYGRYFLAVKGPKTAPTVVRDASTGMVIGVEQPAFAPTRKIQLSAMHDADALSQAELVLQSLGTVPTPPPAEKMVAVESPIWVTSLKTQAGTVQPFELPEMPRHDNTLAEGIARIFNAQ
jgi:hypothetical protein